MRHVRRSTIAALGLLASTAIAQAMPMESLSLNFTKITFVYREQKPDAGLPFHLELTRTPAGGVEAIAKMHKATDVTLKRGVIGSASMPGSLELAVQSRTPAGDVDGDGLADIITGAGAGGGPHVKALDGTTDSGQRTSHLALSLPPGELPAAGFELRFQPLDGARVSGFPAHLFNRPAPGEPLVGLIKPALLGEGKKVTIDFVKHAVDQSTTVVVTLQ